MKKAFTLIELLVVIAIIAILAAILFPVFAQAKQAAKGAASVSNAKQLALGSLMYNGDADDTMVISAVWNSGNDPIQFGGGVTCGPWSWLVQPYMKNGQIYDDPTNSATPKLGASISETVSKLFVPQYGYNYSYLSPNVDDGNGGVMQRPISATAVGQPADTVLLTSKWSYTESVLPTTGKFWSFSPNGVALWATVEAPDCAFNQNYCSSNWGLNDGFVNSASYQGVTKYEAGAQTGGVSLHAGEGAVVSFVDGHTKKLKPGALAAGTTWAKDQDASLTKVVDKTKYLWDIE